MLRVEYILCFLLYIYNVLQYYIEYILYNIQCISTSIFILELLSQLHPSHIFWGMSERIKKPMLYRIAYLDICVFVSTMEKNTQIHENTNMWYVSTMENSQWIKWPMLYRIRQSRLAWRSERSVTSHNWASSELRYCSHHITLAANHAGLGSRRKPFRIS